TTGCRGSFAEPSWASSTWPSVMVVNPADCRKSRCSSSSCGETVRGSPPSPIEWYMRMGTPSPHAADRAAQRSTAIRGALTRGANLPFSTRERSSPCKFVQLSVSQGRPDPLHVGDRLLPEREGERVGSVGEGPIGILVDLAEQGVDAHGR